MEMSFSACKILVFGCLLAVVELKPITLDPSAEPIILVRLKRSPNRAFTFSGFNPNTGLSAFATSADFYPSYYRYVPSPPSPSPSPPSPPPPNYAVEGHEDPSPSYVPSGESDSSYNYPPIVEFPSLNSSEEDRKVPSPSQNLTPPADNTPVTGFGANANPIQPAPPKKPKKKPNRVNPAPLQEEEEDAEENEGRSRSSSSASFNAWFPIVLGSYPSRPNPESYKEDLSSPLKEKSPGSTVIANSVSNGRSGVASSHAVLYGGESPVQSYRRG